MIKKIYILPILYILSILLPVMVLADQVTPSFTATINSANIAANETIDLTLTLKGAEGKWRPNLSVVEKDFIIRSSRQSSNVRIINGQTDVSRTWNLQIRPKSTGNLLIPPFTIKTAKGTLKTKTIKIKVSQLVKENPNIRIITTISKTKPYVSEAVIYKLKIISQVEFTASNLALPASDNFIMEQFGKVDQYNQINNGIQEVVSEITYILTPLKSGNIVIDPISLSGDIKIKNNRVTGRQLSFFSSNFALFDNQYKPFSIKGKKIKLNVKTAATALDSWLPLHSLKISEKWHNLENAMVGEPINRTIKITAIGTQGSQLPDNEYVKSNQYYKSYTDKPKIKDGNNKYNIPTTTKTISYTIIPQKEGKITIPAVNIAWWNVNAHKLKYAKLPPKTILIAKSEYLTAAQNFKDGIADNIYEQKDAAKQPAIDNILQSKKSKASMMLMMLLSTLLALAIGYIFWLQRKLGKIGGDNFGQKTSPNYSNNKVINSLKSAKNASQLYKAISDYSHIEFNMAKNSAIEDIKAQLISVQSDQEEAIKELFDQINKALYAEGKINFKQCQSKLIAIIKNININRNKKTKTKTVLQLNP